MDRYRLTGDNVFPEGITEGPGATFFVGSLGTGAIYQGDTSVGEVEMVLPPDGDGRQAIAGLDIGDRDTGPGHPLIGRRVRWLGPVSFPQAAVGG